MDGLCCARSRGLYFTCPWRDQGVTGSRGQNTLEHNLVLAVSFYNFTTFNTGCFGSSNKSIVCLNRSFFTKAAYARSIVFTDECPNKCWTSVIAAPRFNNRVANVSDYGMKHHPIQFSECAFQRVIALNRFMATVPAWKNVITVHNSLSIQQYRSQTIRHRNEIIIGFLRTYRPYNPPPLQGPCLPRDNGWWRPKKARPRESSAARPG